MSLGDFNVPLTLSTACEGKLEEEFQNLYPAILSQLRHGDKATVNITLEFKRVPDTTTMINLGYKVTPRFPAKSKASVCQLTGDNRLQTEKPQRPFKVAKLFEEGNV